MSISKQIGKNIYFYDLGKNKIAVNCSSKSGKKHLKIGIIMDTAFSFPPTTGFTWRLYYLSEKLSELGHEIVWFLGNRNFTTEKEIKDFKNPHLKIYIIPPKHFYNLKFLNRIIAKEKLDIVQYEITQTFLSLGVPLRQKNRIPVVLEIHDVEAVLREGLGRNREVNLMEFLQFIAGHEAGALVVFTPTDKDLLMNRIEVPKHKIYLAPIGVGSEYPYNGINLQENILLFLGNIFYPPNREAVVFLIEKVLPLVSKRINDVKIKIIGGVPRDLLKRYQNRRNVIFTQEIRDLEEFNKELGTCTLGLCTVFAGSGMKVKILNYCASGLPVIVTPIGLSGYEEIKGLICVKPNATSIAEAIVSLLKNKKMAVRLGLENRKMILRKFSWDKTVKEMIKIYHFLIDSSKCYYIKIPQPFWLEEKRHKKRVLPDCWLINNNNKVKKIRL